MLQKPGAIIAVLLVSMSFLFSCSKTLDQATNNARSTSNVFALDTAKAAVSNNADVQAKASLPNSNYITYIGYTEGQVGCPTLYFKEGRYTQCHSDPSNVGWHPAKSDLVAANISSTGYNLYYSDRNTFLYYFVRGYYRGTYRYFEYSRSAGTTHMSRGVLYSPDSRYSSTYARNVVKNGKVAANAY